jgi:excisionase family DNA binding protein
MGIKLRTIAEAYKYLVEIDPGTAITKSALRRLVASGDIPSVQVGRKRLLDIEVLQEKLRSGIFEPKLPDGQYGEVRHIY